MHPDAVYQPCPLVEGVEGQLLNERYPIHQNVVALGPELNTLHFLASHDWPHIGLGDAYYPVRNAFTDISAPEVVMLLAVHLRDDVKRLSLSLCP